MENEEYIYLGPEAWWIKNNSDEENICKDDEAREYPDKDNVACEIVISVALPTTVEV